MLTRGGRIGLRDPSARMVGMSVSDPPKYDFLAALLSYLIPGLGQVIQGRVAKGLLFFCCLYSLFFYGMWLGKMKNVWMPDPRQLPEAELPILGKLNGVPLALYHRPQYLAQFWMGVAVWPAIVQYSATEWPERHKQDDPNERTKPTRFLGHYMQAPTETELNQLQRSEDKTWDLGWVYTVIAGVLSLLVILDAFAGPVVKEDDPHWNPPPAADPGKPSDTNMTNPPTSTSSASSEVPR